MMHWRTKSPACLAACSARPFELPHRRAVVVRRPQAARCGRFGDAGRAADGIAGRARAPSAAARARARGAQIHAACHAGALARIPRAARSPTISPRAAITARRRSRYRASCCSRRARGRRRSLCRRGSLSARRNGAAKGVVHLVEHDLFRPCFARRSGLREGGKPVPTFRDHALSIRDCSSSIAVAKPWLSDISSRISDSGVGARGFDFADHTAEIE